MSGFFLLPHYRNCARNGLIKSWSDDFIAVLPVLIAHENTSTRECYPSLARLATLAGMSKTTVAKELNKLRQGGWLGSVMILIANGRCKKIYTMRYIPYVPGESDPKYWIRIDREIIMQGIWATMRPATRRLYLQFRGSCRREEQADDKWIANPEDLAGVEATAAFLPAEFLEPDFLAKNTGLARRTIRDSQKWLLDNGLAYPTETDQEPGLFLPFAPGRYAPRVLDALAAPQEQDAPREREITSAYVNRSLRKMRREHHGERAKKSLKLANKKPKVIQLVNSDAA